MPFNPKTPEDAKLRECAKYCYSISKQILEDLPITRESQKTLANFLEKKISEAGQDFSIGAEYLTQRVGCTDRNLIERWQGRARDLAWLMVHEQLANYFAKFVIENWDPEVYLIHHVPKSAGTSVSGMVHRQSYFIAYPRTGFAAMNSLLGFSRQLGEFENHLHTDRIYIGGHYNLPEMVQKLGTSVRRRGVSLTRSPTGSMSSAIRFVWTNVEEGDPFWTAAYPSLDAERLKWVRKAAVAGDSDGLMEMRKLADAIMESPKFQENYFDLHSKYYYNKDVQDVFALRRLFEDCPDLMPSVDLARDEAAVCGHLGVDGPIPRVNESVFSHKHLALAYGGEAAFIAVIAPAIVRGAEIYGALCMLQAPKVSEVTLAA